MEPGRSAPSPQIETGFQRDSRLLLTRVNLALAGSLLLCTRKMEKSSYHESEATGVQAQGLVLKRANVSFRLVIYTLW
jgi:hypothetical protein